MITFGALRGVDFGMLTEHLTYDPDGAARISLAPARWWELVHTDPARHGWIVECHGEAVGYLDAEQDHQPDADQHAGAGLPVVQPVVYLAALLFPSARGRGLAGEVLDRALELPELATAAVLLAYVEPDNHPARLALLRAGFLENGRDTDGMIEHRRPQVHYHRGGPGAT